MRKIIALTIHSFKEVLYSKVILIVLPYILLMMLCVVFLNASDNTDKVKVIESVSFIVISFLGTILSLVLPVLSLSEEIETRKIYSVLTKPVNRFTFLTSKVAGILLFIFLFIGVLSLLSYLFIIFSDTGEEDVLTANRLKHADRCSLVREDSTEKDLLKRETFTCKSEYSKVRWIFSGITKKDFKNGFIYLNLNLNAYGVGIVMNIEYSEVYMVGLNPEEKKRFPVSDIKKKDKTADYILMPRNGMKDVCIPQEAVSSQGKVVIELLRPGSKYRLFPNKKSVRIYLKKGSFMMNYVKAVLLLFMKFIFIATVSVCGGAFFSLTSGISFGLFIILMSYMMQFIRESAGPSERDFYKMMSSLFRFLSPEFSRFSKVYDLIEGLYIRWSYVWYTFGLSVCVYSLIYLGIAYVGLKDREL